MRNVTAHVFQCNIRSTIRAAWITLARSAAVIAPRAMMSSRLRRVCVHQEELRGAQLEGFLVLQQLADHVAHA